MVAHQAGFESVAGNPRKRKKTTNSRFVAKQRAYAEKVFQAVGVAIPPTIREI